MLPGMLPARLRGQPGMLLPGILLPGRLRAARGPRRESQLGIHQSQNLLSLRDSGNTGWESREFMGKMGVQEFLEKMGWESGEFLGKMKWEPWGFLGKMENQEFLGKTGTTEIRGKTRFGITGIPGKNRMWINRNSW